jgi:hypothetical protein
MNKITCLADMIAHVPRVRVIKTTTSFVDNWYESEIDSINYEVKSVSIRNKSWLRSTFNFANVQFLTPVQYEWRYIGLGDKINWSEVFDYCWHDDKWNVRYAIGWDYTNIDILSELQVNRLRTFQPLHKLTPKIELSTEEMIEELRRRWIDFADLY